MLHNAPSLLSFFSLGHVPTTRRSLCPSCSSTPAILSAVIAVIVTALLATVIFVVVQVVICKCHPKFRPGGTETAGEEGQEYEQMDRGATETGVLAGGEGQEYEMVVGGYERGVTVNDNHGATYMEVGEQRGQLGKHTFELQQNEAYGTCSP